MERVDIEIKEYYLKWNLYQNEANFSNKNLITNALGTKW